MQLFDFQQLFIAPSFSNSSRGAPMLNFRRVAGRLSTKLSTASVDDLECPRRSCELLPACHNFCVEADPGARP